MESYICLVPETIVLKWQINSLQGTQFSLQLQILVIIFGKVGLENFGVYEMGMNNIHDGISCFNEGL